MSLMQNLKIQDWFVTEQHLCRRAGCCCAILSNSSLWTIHLIIMSDFFIRAAPVWVVRMKNIFFVILIMNPLFNDIQMRLFYLNHSPYSWHWNVRFRPQEAVYIGSDTCHITITCNQSGFHLTRDGQRLFTERYIRNLNELLPVLKRRWDVTPAIIRAVEYLSRVPVSH